MYHLFLEPYMVYGPISSLTIALTTQFLFFLGLLFAYEKVNVVKLILTEIQIFITNLVKNYISVRQYDKFFFALFLFISVQNILSTFGFMPIFASPYIILFLCGHIFILSIVIGLYKRGIRFFLAFCPSGVPIFLRPLVFLIEFALFFTKPVSLGARLLLNVAVGHLLIFVMSTSLPIFLLPLTVFIQCLELCTGFLQAYLFVNFSAHIFGLCIEDSH